MSLETDWIGLLVGSVRFLAVFVAAPVFGHAALPGRVRVGLAVVVAAGLGAWPAPGRLSGPDIGLAGLVASEVLFGLVVGFGARLVFAGFGLMGELISIQGGLGAASVLDPSTGTSSPALSSFAQISAVLIFLAIGGDHALLQVLARSLDAVPLGGFAPGPGAFAELAGLGKVVFEVAVRLALPVTVAMLLANLAVGILGRTIPQLNLMTVQLPALVGVTLTLLLLGGTAFVDATSASLHDWFERVWLIASGAQ